MVIFTGVTVKPRESDSHSLLVKLEKVGQTVFKFQSMSILITTDDRKQIQCITLALNSITGLLFFEFSDARDDLAFHKDSK